MLGGKLGKSLRDAGLEMMGQIQTMDVEHELVPLIGYEKAQWVKDLSLGLCDEEVVEKQAPKTASAIKTFKEIYSFEKIVKQIHLVGIDLIMKIKEHLKEKNVFPQSLLMYQRKNMVWSHDREALKANTFKKSTKMIEIEAFKEDPQRLIH